MKLASVETVSEIQAIPDADKIELALIQGWQSIMKKNEFKAGDRVIFVPIDTVLEPREWNRFLWHRDEPSKPIRIKTIRLRGTVSQGVLFPLSIAEKVPESALPAFLGISKYEKPAPSNLAGSIIGDCPSFFISKTDEDNLLSNLSAFEELKWAQTVVATLKLDGAFRVCSRNMELAETEHNAHWMMARKHRLRESMREGTILQGEIAGPGSQANPAGLSELELFLFNYKDLASNPHEGVTSPLMQAEFQARGGHGAARHQ